LGIKARSELLLWLFVPRSREGKEEIQEGRWAAKKKKIGREVLEGPLNRSRKPQRNRLRDAIEKRLIENSLLTTP